VSAPLIQSRPPLLYDLPSILKRLDLTKLFPESRPLQVELGCGDASFLVEYARRHPEENFLGVERLLGRVRKLERKGLRLGLQNIRGLRIESAYFLEFLLPPHAAEAIHVYFPDPWPKLKHRRHRLVNERFVGLSWRALVPGGTVYLRTDDRDYFQQMTSVFDADARFRQVETPAELADVITDFERDFNAAGTPTQRAAYQRGRVSDIDDRPVIV